ncbi:unnamed protein product, partial [Oikopleura dioica]
RFSFFRSKQNRFHHELDRFQYNVIDAPVKKLLRRLHKRLFLSNDRAFISHLFAFKAFTKQANDEDKKVNPERYSRQFTEFLSSAVFAQWTN